MLRKGGIFLRFCRRLYRDVEAQVWYEWLTMCGKADTRAQDETRRDPSAVQDSRASTYFTAR